MAALLTLGQGLAHVKYPDASVLPASDVADLQLKLDTAHAWILLSRLRTDGVDL